MALEIRPAHDPAKDYGFCGVVVDTTNLQGAIFTWWQKDDGTFEAKKTITIDPRPEKAENLPPLLQGFEAVPPLVTDIDLSLDDKYLYVACWGLGEMHQYDVSDPMNPKLAGKVEIGGIARGTKHPTARISSTARRWSRSAATASASTGPTRSTRPGTTSSTRMTRAARW
jgi:selenium-binding protein 1